MDVPCIQALWIDFWYQQSGSQQKDDLSCRAIDDSRANMHDSHHKAGGHASCIAAAVDLDIKATTNNSTYYDNEQNLIGMA